MIFYYEVDFLTREEWELLVQGVVNSFVIFPKIYILGYLVYHV